MSVLVVDGTISEVLSKLTNINDVIDDKRSSGYPLFHSSENWRYVTADDDRVCRICGPLNGDVFAGDDVMTEFPSAIYLGDYVTHPKTHDNPNFPDDIERRRDDPEGCGCRLHLLNPAEAFEEQLHRDKKEAM